jgi:hypothetical protein
MVHRHTVVTSAGDEKMNVVPIHFAVCRETEATLVHLLACTRAGKCRGVAVSSDIEGVEDIVFTGKYRRHPSAGGNAAIRMSVRAAQLQEDMEATNR